MKWFKEIFLPSFENCNDRKITEKQANIFMKYLKNVKENECSTEYSDTIDERKIVLTDSIEWHGWKNGRPNKESRFYLTIN